MVDRQTFNTVELSVGKSRQTTGQPTPAIHLSNRLSERSLKTDLKRPPLDHKLPHDATKNTTKTIDISPASDFEKIQ